MRSTTLHCQQHDVRWQFSVFARQTNCGILKLRSWHASLFFVFSWKEAIVRGMRLKNPHLYYTKCHEEHSRNRKIKRAAEFSDLSCL